MPSCATKLLLLRRLERHNVLRHCLCVLKYDHDAGFAPANCRSAIRDTIEGKHPSFFARWRRYHAAGALSVLPHCHSTVEQVRHTLMSRRVRWVGRVAGTSIALALHCICIATAAQPNPYLACCAKYTPFPSAVPCWPQKERLKPSSHMSGMARKDVP